MTDPPYGVSYDARGERAMIENDDGTPEEMHEFWLGAFRQALARCRAGACHYVTAPQGGLMMMMMMMALRDAGWLVKHQLVWIKQSFVLGRADYHYRHEPILYGWKPGAGHFWGGGTAQDSVWEIDRPQRSELHPTTKPVELFARAMRNSSREGELVLDPFSGSGTTLVAAEQLGRRCAAVEISPAYCDVIVERWQNLTGGKAVRG